MLPLHPGLGSNIATGALLAVSRISTSAHVASYYNYSFAEIIVRSFQLCPSILSTILISILRMFVWLSPIGDKLSRQHPRYSGCTGPGRCCYCHCVSASTVHRHLLSATVGSADPCIAHRRVHGPSLGPLWYFARWHSPYPNLTYA